MSIFCGNLTAQESARSSFRKLSRPEKSWVVFHPFVAKKTLAQTKNFKTDGLKNIYQQLLNIDLKLKTSQVDPQVLFDLLIVKS